jgi:hypothetical protein
MMRQLGCIELGRQDALILRDIIRPLAPVPPYEPGSLIVLCRKLYAGLLRLELDAGTSTINIPIDAHEALFINQFVGSQDWEGASALLQQTWLVLYELEHEARYPRTWEAVGGHASPVSTRGSWSDADSSR